MSTATVPVKTNTRKYNVYAVLRDEHGNGTPLQQINNRPMTGEKAEAEVTRLLNGKAKAIRAYAVKV